MTSPLTKRCRTLFVSLLIGGALAPLISLASEIHDVYEGKVNRADVSRFDEGDTVIYHRADGATKKFVLGPLSGEGNNGRVFELTGSSPPKVIKFSKRGTTHFADQEIESFRAMDVQGIAHAKIHDYDPDFYIIKDKVQGMTLDYLDADLDQYPHGERIQIVKALALALQDFDQALRRGPQAFSDLHLGNVMFDGKAIQIIDAAATHDDPALSAGLFAKSVKELPHINAALTALRASPEWLEILCDLQDARGYSFLDSENKSAEKIRSAFRLGHPVPVSIQELILEVAESGASSPRFHERVEPILLGILARAEVIPSEQRSALWTLLSQVKDDPALVDLAKKISAVYAERPLPAYFRGFFSQLARKGSWNGILRVFHQIPPQFKPYLILAAAEASSTPGELMRAISLPLGTDPHLDLQTLKLTLLRANPLPFERLGKGRGSKVFLGYRDLIRPGESAKSRQAYAELYSELTRSAIMESKSGEEVAHCFHDLPTRMTPEVREKLAILPTSLKMHFDALRVPEGDRRRLADQAAPQNKRVSCIVRSFSEIARALRTPD